MGRISKWFKFLKGRYRDLNLIYEGVEEEADKLLLRELGEVGNMI